mmetsp:Transcript_364/g.536  ORF Transcript_364/g.536 Transcript_364/m.536 type:complete len:223 (-) Transcript_364:1074-1742(-)
MLHAQHSCCLLCPHYHYPRRKPRKKAGWEKVPGRARGQARRAPRPPHHRRPPAARCHPGPASLRSRQGRRPPGRGSSRPPGLRRRRRCGRCTARCRRRHCCCRRRRGWKRTRRFLLLVAQLARWGPLWLWWSLPQGWSNIQDTPPPELGNNRLASHQLHIFHSKNSSLHWDQLAMDMSPGGGSTPGTPRPAWGSSPPPPGRRPRTRCWPRTRPPPPPRPSWL